jgi:hypothetical protein
LRVTEDQSFFPTWLQREDAHLERAAVEPFQKRRVALLIDDLLEDAAGILALGHAAFHEPAIDVHGQSRQQRIRRQREIERPFEPGVRVVEVGLIDGRAGEAVFDVNIDAIGAQAQLRFLAVRVADNQSAAGVLAGGH